MVEKIISKRVAPIYWDNPFNKMGSLKVTLTSELLDLGIDPNKDDLEKVITATLTEEEKIKKIIIEKVKN